LAPNIGFKQPFLAELPKDWRAAQDVHVAPGYGPWKQTSSRSITVWTQPGDLLRTKNDGSNLWKRLRSGQGHARDDDFLPSMEPDPPTLYWVYPVLLHCCCNSYLADCANLRTHGSMLCPSVVYLFVTHVLRLNGMSYRKTDWRS